MNEMIQIFKTEIPVIEYQGIRFVTCEMIDEVHGNDPWTAFDLFHDNLTKYIEGEDYIDLSHQMNSSSLYDALELDELDGILLTEIGYSLLAKAFIDEQSNAIQRKMLNKYFCNHVSAEWYTETDATYFTSLAFCRKEGVQSEIDSAHLGKDASQMCKKLGVPTGKIHDKNLGSVKLYPAHILRECLNALD